MRKAWCQSVLMKQYQKYKAKQRNKLLIKCYTGITSWIITHLESTSSSQIPSVDNSSYHISLLFHNCFCSGTIISLFFTLLRYATEFFSTLFRTSRKLTYLYCFTILFHLQVFRCSSYDLSARFRPDVVRKLLRCKKIGPILKNSVAVHHTLEIRPIATKVF